MTGAKPPPQKVLRKTLGEASSRANVTPAVARSVEAGARIRLIARVPIAAGAISRRSL
jgi:hypothetical protein